jgi:hypothetical protein
MEHKFTFVWTGGRSWKFWEDPSVANYVRIYRDKPSRLRPYRECPLGPWALLIWYDRTPLDPRITDESTARASKRMPWDKLAPPH